MPAPLVEIAQQQLHDIIVTQRFVVTTVLSWVCLELLASWLGPRLLRNRVVQLNLAWIKRVLRVEPRRVPRVDLVYWLLNPAVRTVARAAVTAAMVVGGLLLGQEFGGRELLEGYGPIARQPRWLLVIELFLLGDLGSYWIHRWCHTVPWLWRMHAIHHSSQHIMWTSTARQHPLNEILNAFYALPLFLLGFPVSLLAAYGPAVGLFAIFQHTGLNVSMGPFRSIINSPNFHRWHHTLSHEGGNKNFANVFSFWDRLFGTYYMPENRFPEKFGLDHEVIPDNFATQFMYPFRSAPRAAEQPPPPQQAAQSSAAPSS